MWSGWLEPGTLRACTRVVTRVSNVSTARRTMAPRSSAATAAPSGSTLPASSPTTPRRDGHPSTTRTRVCRTSVPGAPLTRRANLARLPPAYPHPPSPLPPHRSRRSPSPSLELLQRIARRHRGPLRQPSRRERLDRFPRLAGCVSSSEDRAAVELRC